LIFSLNDVRRFVFINLSCLIVNDKGVSAAPVVPRVPVERFPDKGAKIKRIEGLGCVKIKIYDILNSPPCPCPDSILYQHYWVFHAGSGLRR
jgi:hypothetical protein